jgi:hypothetical protein
MQVVLNIDYVSVQGDFEGFFPFQNMHGRIDLRREGEIE